MVGNNRQRRTDGYDWYRRATHCKSSGLYNFRKHGHRSHTKQSSKRMAYFKFLRIWRNGISVNEWVRSCWRNISLEMAKAICWKFIRRMDRNNRRSHHGIPLRIWRRILYTRNYMARHCRSSSTYKC